MVLGTLVVPAYIKNKKQKGCLNQFLDKLRTANCFRERQLYLFIAQATAKANPEIFKKHFAKVIGLDMLNEKTVCV